ncbi:endonuclease V [Clostridium beijerinckii]|nr:endonuclease V [Clostridium beijerinckii]OOM52588.1 endonuclease V [Clostridium beijerinckii]
MKMNTENLDEKSCYKIQESLMSKINIEKLNCANIRYIAGIDLAYWNKEDIEYAVCCAVVVDYKTKEIIEKAEYSGKIVFPYIPGCLAFRELPLVLEAVKKLQVNPDLYVFDGNGYLHPRHMGIATHAGIYLNKPTIGVAKSYYKIDNTDFEMPENIEGSYTDITINGEIYGRVLRTHKDIKPIFISIGNHIDLETSTKVIKSLVTKESHIPIPTRLADIETHKMRELYKHKMNYNE